MIDVVLGLQRGDEGKGRFVDLLAKDYNIVARFNGGPNAGHTIAHDKLELKLHQVPSGITYPGVLNIIGNGSYVDPIKLLDEITEIEAAGIKVGPESLKISSDAHLILPHHIMLDKQRESSSGGQGSTKSGIAFVARDKYERSGVKTERLLGNIDDLRRIVTEKLQELGKGQDADKLVQEWTEKAVKIRPFITDTFVKIHEALGQNKNILAEGAQATGLDIEHGMYPYVTSSHITTGGVLNGLGVGPKHIDRVIGVAKVLRSHVGGGPFVTKESDPTKAAAIRGKQGKIDSEYGATTGRERQVGYLDLPELRKAILVSGVTELAITKLDILPRAGKTIPVATAYRYEGKKLTLAPSSAQKLEQCEPIYEQFPSWQEDISSVRSYKDLPKNAQKFIEFLEKELEVPVTMMGVGPYREQVIFKKG